MDRDAWKIDAVARISPRAARRLAIGHVWVYRSDVLDVSRDTPGFVWVEGAPDGRRLGVAMLSPSSEIMLRLWSSSAAAPRPDDLRDRMSSALELRRRALPARDAYRWVHGESDALPGIYVDVYGDCVAVQTTCAAADRLEAEVVQHVAATLSPRAVVLRDLAAGRRREGLREHVTVAVGSAPVVASYHEGDLAMSVDLLADQKTGAFLDQAHNHLIAARYAHGQGLDCFTYHGGFALQAARRCDRIIACDQSDVALQRGRANAERAGIDNIEWVAADVFELLRTYERERRRFDFIVLDPPAFASSKATVGNAMRAYHEINLRAFKLLGPGGVLVSCSCSGRVIAAQFDGMLAEAAADARRRVQLLDSRGAGPDHPQLVGMPESAYLKFRVLRAL